MYMSEKGLIEVNMKSSIYWLNFTDHEFIKEYYVGNNQNLETWHQID